MKKIVAGGFMMIAGVILYIGYHIPAAMNTFEITGWSNPPGRYGTALLETGGRFPMILGIIVGLAGFLILLWGTFSKELSILTHKLKLGNEEYEKANGVDE
ncbi:hypothetical protein J2T13_000033 [Paenibacillus sp. DS2015]|uniref:hypothetical protein n=1 Tax=Paenibacillus sp. DS2015 TaxID=3373917 RepID=UPI003D1F66AC